MFRSSVSLALALLAIPQRTASLQHVKRHEMSEPEEEEVPWFANVSMFHFPQLFAKDVAGPELLATLSQETSKYVLVDFYSPWCPHCQHFAPEFERISLAAQRMRQQSTEQNSIPSIMTITVDCVRHASTCKDWGVHSYPTLLWGERGDWLEQNALKKLAPIEVRPIDAETVSQWINTRLNINLVPAQRSELHIAKPPITVLAQEAVGSNPASGKSTADAWDAELATALLIRTALENGLNDKRKAAFLDFTSLLHERFPEAEGQQQCKDSFGTLGSKLNLLDTGTIDVDALEKEWQPCGIAYDQYAQGWHMCRGTWPGKRGYTCGLWTLLHMLAAQSTNESASRDLETMRATIGNFFGCKECREHFLAIPVPSGGVSTRRDLQLWLWNAHNIVNRRVMKLEDKYQDSDPQFPKLSWWPSQELCPTCRKSATSKSILMRKDVGVLPALPTLQDAAKQENLDLQEVGAFLDTYYGGQ